MPRIPIKAAVAAVLPLLIAGCGVFGGDELEQRREAGDLRIPPDLEIVRDPLALTVPDIEGEAEAQTPEPVLPESPRVEVTRFGELRWITVDSPPEEVWAGLERFLDAQGVPLDTERPALGLVETEWLYTARPFGRGPFAPRVEERGAAEVADRYLIRVERGAGQGDADVFVAHRRLARDDSGDWRYVGADPFLEAELLRSLAVYFGVPPQQSVRRVAGAGNVAPAAGIERTDSGDPVLVLEQDFFDAWRRVGLALDRAAFTVSQRNRDQRYYEIRYDTQADTVRPEEGFFESLAFWREDIPETVATYRLTFEPVEQATRLRLVTAAGEPAPADLAEEILVLLRERLQ
jgi:outer membrane protein assembly factor BamC